MPTDDAKTATAGRSFVLRCRVDRIPEGGTRPHFVLEEVGADLIWRFTDVDPVLDTLRTRIARLLSGSASVPPVSET